MAQARDATLNVNIISTYNAGQSFGGVLAYRLAVLFATSFGPSITTREAIVVTSLGYRSMLWSRLLAVSLLTQADILIGPGVVVERNQSEAGFRHAGADAVGPGELI